MIDPSKVKYFNSIPMKFYKSSKFIIDFDWDKENKLIAEHELNHQVYGSCREIFIDGVSIEKCKMFSYLQKILTIQKNLKVVKIKKTLFNS